MAEDKEAYDHIGLHGYYGTEACAGGNCSTCIYNIPGAVFRSGLMLNFP